MKELIVNVAVSKLRNVEVAQLVVHSIEDYEASKLKTTDEDFKRLVAKLKQTLTTYQGALEQVKVSEVVHGLNEADRQRDTDLRALMDSIHVYRHSKRPAEQKAYTALSLLLKQYKGILTKGHEEESGMITSLLANLKSTEYQDDVQALGITKFVTNLTESQTVFHTLAKSRSQERLEKRQVNTKALREQLLSDYLILLRYVEVMTYVKTGTFYTQVMNILNNVRHTFAFNTSRRNHTRKKKGKSDDVTLVADTPQPIVDDTDTSVADSHHEEATTSEEITTGQEE